MKKAAPTSKLLLWLGGGAVILVITLRSYSSVALENSDTNQAEAEHLELADFPSRDNAPSQAGEGHESSLGWSEDDRAPLGLEPELEPVGGGKESAPVREYEREMALYLNSFASDQPDLLGWTEYLSRLAIDAELDLESIHSDEKGTHGVLLLPGSDLSIEVSHLDSGYTLAIKAQVEVHAAGTVGFQSTMALPVDDRNLAMLYGTVQFFPNSSQAVFEENPMGFVYEMEDGGSSFRPMQAKFDDGSFSVMIESKNNAQQSQLGDLSVPYTLMLRLQELSSFSND